MISTRLRCLLFLVPFVVGLAGCQEKSGPAEIPKDQNQPLPKLAAPVGGGGGAPKSQKPANPTGEAD